MTEYVRMPKAHYEAALNAIRAKTGKTDLIKSGDMSAEIDSITSGGGSSADVHYVTFMNRDGTKELGKKAVADGDDCADPIARGLFGTPTEESTDQYNFTFSGGWATVPNGGADANALKAVKADRVVYADFIATLRTYTITYNDEDGTFLHSETLSYGAMPSYIPTKDGAAFENWKPALAPVTGDASYTASWKSVVASGTLGDNAYWSLDANYVLSISGTGAMHTYRSTSENNWNPAIDFPWYSYKDRITAVVIGNGITSISGYAFYKYSAITSVTIPEGVTSIGENAFYSCSGLAEITIPNSVTIIGANAFNSTKITSLVIPDSVKTIGGSAFASVPLTSLTLGNSVTSIGESAFTSAKITELIIPDSVTSIGRYAFRWCSTITSLTIGNNVTSIGESAFYSCKGLMSVTIPASVKSIERSAFEECSALMSATFEDTEGWYRTTTSGATSGTTLDVSYLENPSTAAYWLRDLYSNNYWYKS